MAVDIFMKIGDIKGESRDKTHPGEIELLSFSWGETNVGAHSATGGAGAGKVSMQDFHFTATVSKASPKLMLACASGQHIPTAQITLRKAGAEEQGGFEFLFFKLSNVIVSSFQTGGNNEVLPVDSASLAFQKIQVEYKEQDFTGKIGEVVKFGWDLKANKTI
ncbi:MAG TPA: type VI secretion system tube protein Hcp [Candidatus Dormibacteraeota bacterium]|jgi:type VI secretion system secreted protein Hcp